VCLAVPARVVEVHADGGGVVELGGVRQDIRLDLVPDAAVGEFVVVHVGFALARLDVAETERTLALVAAQRDEAP